MGNKFDNEYISRHSMPEPEILQQLYRETWLKVYAPQMIAGQEQGNLLRMVSHMIRPKYILEIGTFTGYSAICLSYGLLENGKLHTVELNRELDEIAGRYFLLSGFSDRIVQHFGDARNIIPGFDIIFDLVYIDAAKELYIDFYELSLQKLRKGGFILADNVLWYGKVSNPKVKNDKDTAAIRKFNDYISQDERVENIILPFRDGIMLIRKK